ncbi:hypothetical protein D6825_00285 [Candidatus Woesearchaeota archaeon]|nr:MAG: hypothetical protein D6825_00285 [Candidatus Woesearchaeota archaeon]
MAKKAIITILLAIVIASLLYIASQQQTQIIYTQPVEKPQKTEQKSPIAQPIERGEPTPKAELPKPGIEAEKIYPESVEFWVNEIQVPQSSQYETGNFIPLKENRLKTFAGIIGPYAEDPRDYITVKLCAELRDYDIAPVCEIMPLSYKNNYVTFARGYASDEYIGGLAARDYTAYYNVYAGDTQIAVSNKAVIRTVSD